MEKLSRGEQTTHYPIKSPVIYIFIIFRLKDRSYQFSWKNFANPISSNVRSKCVLLILHIMNNNYKLWNK